MKEVYLYGPERRQIGSASCRGKVRFIYRNRRRLFTAEADQKSFMNLIMGVKAQPSRGADAGFLVLPWGGVGMGPRSIGTRAGDP
jgi:hypothetical protein